MSSAEGSTAAERCYLQCNPSSLHQRLVLGSDHRGTNLEKLSLAKQHCVQGCRYADAEGRGGRAGQEGLRTLAELNAKTPPEAILGRDDKRSRIEALEEVANGVKESCYARCQDLCRSFVGATDTSGQPAFQAYNSQSCALNCSEGCKLYTDSLEYR